MLAAYLAEWLNLKIFANDSSNYSQSSWLRLRSGHTKVHGSVPFFLLYNADLQTLLLRRVMRAAGFRQRLCHEHSFGHKRSEASPVGWLAVVVKHEKALIQRSVVQDVLKQGDQLVRLHRTRSRDEEQVESLAGVFHRLVPKRWAFIGSLISGALTLCILK